MNGVNEEFEYIDMEANVDKECKSTVCGERWLGRIASSVNGRILRERKGKFIIGKTEPKVAKVIEIPCEIENSKVGLNRFC